MNLRKNSSFSFKFQAFLAFLHDYLYVPIKDRNENNLFPVKNIN